MKADAPALAPLHAVTDDSVYQVINDEEYQMNMNPAPEVS
jgi:hypothetical protein